MRILHTSEYYHPDVCGVQRVVQCISEGLAARSHEVIVATGFHPGRKLHDLNGVCIKEFNVYGTSMRGWHGEVEEYRRFVVDCNADVIVNFYTRTWTTDLVFSLLPSLSSVRVLIAGGISVLPNWKWLPYRWRMLRALPNYDQIVYHFENDADHAFGIRNAINDYSIICNGVSDEEFLKSKNGFRSEYNIVTSLMFLCVSNYGPGKDQEMVLRAYQKANIPDSTLVFIGTEFNDYAYRLMSLVKEQDGTVRFLERVPREDVVAAYHEADLFLFGSELECFPLVIVEAMASYTPFISTDVGCVRDLPGGVIVSSTQDMARAIQDLAGHERKRPELAEDGRRAWEQLYRWEIIVDQYESLYLRLCRQRSRNINSKRVVSYEGTCNGQ